MAVNEYNPGYKDVRLFVWLIPVINVINYYLTYTHFSPVWRLVVTFSIDTAEGYLAWLLVRWIVLWLNKKMPYIDNPGKRIVIQLVLTLFVGVSSIILLTQFTNILAGGPPIPKSFYTKDILIISIWFFVINAIYIGMHYYEQWQQSEQKLKQDAAIKSTGFRVSTPKKDLLFAFEDIGGFYIDGDYSVVVTMEKQNYFVDASLDKVEKNLPSSVFFRLNRQYIVHRQLIAGYEKSDNGKINVLLKDAHQLPAAIPVSRTKAPGFKSWLISS